LFWATFAIFVAVSFANSWSEQLFAFHGLAGVGKAIVLLAWIGFVGYSFRCSFHENLVTTVKAMARLHWGRQIGIDLYLSVGLSLAVIGLNSGSLLTVAIWFLPLVVFVNQAMLLYVFLHFDQLVGRFG
jgi:hypothetical protein